tara:strand:- start:278 stop:685 length:408 start_codon:yes stop_codon:yes gene_type:complete
MKKQPFYKTGPLLKTIGSEVGSFGEIPTSKQETTTPTVKPDNKGTRKKIKDIKSDTKDSYKEDDTRKQKKVKRQAGRDKIRSTRTDNAKARAEKKLQQAKESNNPQKALRAQKRLMQVKKRKNRQKTREENRKTE